MKILIVACVAMLTSALHANAYAAMSCESVASLSFPDAKVTARRAARVYRLTGLLPHRDDARADRGLRQQDRNLAHEPTSTERMPAAAEFSWSTRSIPRTTLLPG